MNKIKDRTTTSDKRGFRLVLVVAISLFVWIILSISFITIGYIIFDSTNIEVSILLSGIIWASWYFMMGGYKHFWINPESDTAVILQNYMQSPPKSLSDAEITGPLFVPKGQEAVFTGINPKFPWQIPVGDPISLKAVSPFEDKTVANDKRGIRYEIGYKVLLSPVRSEFLPRFLLTDEKNAGDYFKSEIGKAIRSAFAQVDNGDEIIKDHKNFTEVHIANLFGGNEKITEEENRYGRFSNSPFIVSVQRHPDDQDVAQIPTIMNEVSAGIDKFTSKNIPPNQIPQLVIAALGQRVEMSNINLTGNVPPSTQVGPLPLGGKRRKGKK